MVNKNSKIDGFDFKTRGLLVKDFLKVALGLKYPLSL